MEELQEIKIETEKLCEMCLNYMSTHTISSPEFAMINVSNRQQEKQKLFNVIRELYISSYNVYSTIKEIEKGV